MAKSEPELLPTHRPRCPECTTRMITASVENATRKGFENRTFECLKCGNRETKTMAADPVTSGVAKGWLSGELGQSSSE
jgi:tRNA(Ile2) C34 agmatinyltransferase TiaS